ncbi:IS701 family transposase [Streptomyces mirabilis]|uniref:IS701 family transposase n=1 Tax=Streptomyces mirabilis TaxID=68239 RepID=UPI0037FF22BF
MGETRCPQLCPVPASLPEPLRMAACGHRPPRRQPTQSYGGNVVSCFDVDIQHKLTRLAERNAGGRSLEYFCAQIFGHLLRVDQRRWAHAYLAALLATPGKKSINRLARAVSASPAAAQSLRQFVNVSPWNWRPALNELASWAGTHRSVSAWSIGRAFLPKRGERSVGVHRHYDPLADRTLNCQLGYGAFLCVEGAHIPAAWELSLPGPWSENAQLRRRTRIPDAERYRPMYAHALDLVDSLAAQARCVPPIVADLSDEPEVGPLIEGLDQRGHTFVVGVPPHLPLVLGERPREGPLAPAAQHFVSSGASMEAMVPGAGETGHRITQVLSAPVHLPLPTSRRSATGLCRLFGKRAAGGCPDRIWITNVRRRGLSEAVGLTELSAGPATAVSAMARWFGLFDFEGRSFPGWHHHMTLVSAAYAYGRLGNP